MPTYCYRKLDSDEVISVNMSIAEMQERQEEDGDGEPYIVVDGSKAFRDIGAEFSDRVPSAHGGWPILSESCGVHPNQVKEAEAESRKSGVPTHFTKDGRAILRNKEHRKKYLESRGFYDRNGGYSDPQPK